MPDSPLFRPEALKSRQSLVFGEVRVTTPLVLRRLLAIASLVALILVLVSLIAKYQTKTKVNGQLVPNQGIIRLVAPRRGIVGSIFANEGDEVLEGQRIFSIEGDAMSIGAEPPSRRLAELNQEAIRSVNELLDSHDADRSLKRNDLQNEKVTLTRTQRLAIATRDLQKRRVELEDT